MKIKLSITPDQYVDALSKGADSDFEVLEAMAAVVSELHDFMGLQSSCGSWCVEANGMFLQVQANLGEARQTLYHMAEKELAYELAAKEGEDDE